MGGDGRGLWWVVLSLVCLGAGGAWATPPLTLREALAQADAPVPELEQAEARLQQARAREAAAAASLGLQVKGRARARWIEPPAVFDYLGREDHALELRLSRPLWDGGRTGAARQAAVRESEAAHWAWMGARQGRRYQVLQRFFAVVLADLEYAYRNEAMSIAYVRFDRIRDRQKLGQRSEVEVLAAESVFQQSRRAVYRAQAEQRASRARLALALNRPGDLPAQLEIPLPASFMDWEAGEWATWETAVIEGSPRIARARARLEAERARLLRAGLLRRPRVEAELRSGAYSRQSPANGPWAAGLGLSWPLYHGGAVAAERAEARARLREAEARWEAVKRDEVQAALEDWLALESLRVDWQAARTDLDYRQWRLDEARLRYEQEVESDLGDALVELSRAQLELHRVAYDYALTRARLEARAGRLLDVEWP